MLVVFAPSHARELETPEAEVEAEVEDGGVNQNVDRSVETSAVVAALASRAVAGDDIGDMAFAGVASLGF